MKFLVTEEGINALRQLASRLMEQVEILKQATSTLENELGSNQSGLGPHASSIQSIISEVNTEVQSSSSPVCELSEKVEALATEYQDFIDTDRFH